MEKYHLPGYGETDSVLVTDTTAWTGRASSILIVEATVFATLTGTYKLNTSSVLADATFPAGAILRGFFSAVTLTSGAVWIGLDTAGSTVPVSATEPGAMKYVAPR